MMSDQPPPIAFKSPKDCGGRLSSILLLQTLHWFCLSVLTIVITLLPIFKKSSSNCPVALKIFVTFKILSDNMDPLPLTVTSIIFVTCDYTIFGGLSIPDFKIFPNT